MTDPLREALERIAAESGRFVESKAHAEGRLDAIGDYARQALSRPQASQAIDREEAMPDDPSGKLTARPIMPPGPPMNEEARAAEVKRLTEALKADHAALSRPQASEADIQRLVEAFAADFENEVAFMAGDNKGGWEALARVALSTIRPQASQAACALCGGTGTVHEGADPFWNALPCPECQQGGE